MVENRQYLPPTTSLGCGFRSVAIDRNRPEAVVRQLIKGAYPSRVQGRSRPCIKRPVLDGKPGSNRNKVNFERSPEKFEEVTRSSSV
jgi:hypothetical protein